MALGKSKELITQIESMKEDLEEKLKTSTPVTKQEVTDLESALEESNAYSGRVFQDIHWNSGQIIADCKEYNNGCWTFKSAISSSKPLPRSNWKGIP